MNTTRPLETSSNIRKNLKCCKLPFIRLRIIVCAFGHTLYAGASQKNVKREKKILIKQTKTQIIMMSLLAFMYSSIFITLIFLKMWPHVDKTRKRSNMSLISVLNNSFDPLLYSQMESISLLDNILCRILNWKYCDMVSLMELWVIMYTYHTVAKGYQISPQ